MRFLPPEIVAMPNGLPVSLAEAKRHLREDEADNDDVIGAAIAAAVGHLDGYGGILGRALMTQTWREFRPCWPGSRCVPLALAPVSAIASITCRDSAGGVVTLTPETHYRLLSGRSAQPFVYLPAGVSLPSAASEPDAIKIDYVAGYGDAKALPPDLRSALLMMVGDIYRFRESAAVGSIAAVPVSTTVDRLISPYRRGLLG